MSSFLESLAPVAGELGSSDTVGFVACGGGLFGGAVAAGYDGLLTVTLLVAVAAVFGGTTGEDAGDLGAVGLAVVGEFVASNPPSPPPPMPNMPMDPSGSPDPCV
jgi:hypothetical protein